MGDNSKCELCGISLEDIRVFEGYIHHKDQEDERYPICGKCKVLCEINDKLEFLNVMREKHKKALATKRR